MKNYSSEQLARIISAIVLIMGLLGYHPSVSEGQIVSSIDTLIVSGIFLIGLIVDVFGYFKRWSKGDVTIGGRRI